MTRGNGAWFRVCGATVGPTMRDVVRSRESDVTVGVSGVIVAARSPSTPLGGKPTTQTRRGSAQPPCRAGPPGARNYLRTTLGTGGRQTATRTSQTSAATQSVNGNTVISIVPPRYRNRSHVLIEEFEQELVRPAPHLLWLPWPQDSSPGRIVRHRHELDVGEIGVGGTLDC